ncbi:MAG: TetR/AcrR family transcriptional regulator [Mycobacterium sp.]
MTQNLCADTVHPSGRQQLLEAALLTVAERGAKGATVRMIAERAGVTPGLVVHHFATKERLLAEVDDLVAQQFTDAMTVPEDVTDEADALSVVAEQLSALIGSDTSLRAYLRRAIVDATLAGSRFLQHLIDLTVASLRGLRSSESSLSSQEIRWQAVQIISINLAATLLEPILRDLGPEDPFTPREVQKRTAANVGFIARALGVAWPPRSAGRDD